MKKKKHIKHIKPIPKDIITTPLQLVMKAAIFLWLLLFVTSFVFIFLTAIDYIKAPGQYNAANYENLGEHTLYYRDIESYRTLAKKKYESSRRYRINYQTVINGETFVYSDDNYRTKDYTITVAEANPRVTKYIYIYIYIYHK